MSLDPRSPAAALQRHWLKATKRRDAEILGQYLLDLTTPPGIPWEELDPALADLPELREALGLPPGCQAFLVLRALYPEGCSSFGRAAALALDLIEGTPGYNVGNVEAVEPARLRDFGCWFLDEELEELEEPAEAGEVQP